MVFFAVSLLLLIYASLGWGGASIARPMFPLSLLFIAFLFPPLFFLIVLYSLAYTPYPTVVYVTETTPEAATAPPPPARVLLTPRHARRFL